LITLKLVTGMNFILPSVMTLECETEYTKYSKETDKTFVIYQITQNQIKTSIFFIMTKHKQIFANG
jgi:hypothetical protein